MSNSIDFVVEFRCPKIGASEHHVFADLPEASQQAIIRYGAMRFINDKLGGLDADEASKKFDEIYLQLREGWQGRQQSAGGPDKLTSKALGLARDQIKGAIIAKGAKLKDVGKERIAELAEALFDKNKEAYLEQAQALIDAEAKAKEGAAKAVDLSDLGL